MPEIIQTHDLTSIPTVTAKKPRRFGRAAEVVVFVIVVAVIVILVKILVSQLSLKHEVSAGRVVTDKTVAALQKQDATTARSLGDKTFQANHSSAQLAALFEAAHSHVTGTPLVVKQTVANGDKADAVSVIYKFGGKQTYYIRAIAARESGQSNWQLINLSGDTNESKLLITK